MPSDTKTPGHAAAYTAIIAISAFILLLSAGSALGAMDITYSGPLQTGGSISWNGATYLYDETVNMQGIVFNSSDKVATLYSDSATLYPDSLYYEFRFRNGIDISSASGKGTVTNPEQASPIPVYVLSRLFKIEGASSGQLRMLTGTFGTATPSAPMEYQGARIYPTVGATDSWAFITIVRDGYENITTSINLYDIKQITEMGITIMLSRVTANGMTGEVYGADLAVAQTSEGLTKTYDSVADVTTVGSGSDRFPGETMWGIKVLMGAPEGMINPGDKIFVVYKIFNPVTFQAGSVIHLPGSAGTITFATHTDTSSSVSTSVATTSSAQTSTVAASTTSVATTVPGQTTTARSTTTYMTTTSARSTTTQRSTTTTVQETSQTTQVSSTTFRSTTSEQPTVTTAESICNGCRLDSRCLPIGTRKSGEYCAIEGNMTAQLGGNAACENSFECVSNSCMDGKCVPAGLFTEIIHFFMKLFGMEY
jgi:hypothetical protein